MFLYINDTKDDRTTNTNIKYGDNSGNGQVYNPYGETVDLPGGDAPQFSVSYIEYEEVTPKLLDLSALPEGTSIYYIFPEETNLFHQRRAKIWLAQSISE